MLPIFSVFGMMDILQPTHVAETINLTYIINQKIRQQSVGSMRKKNQSKDTLPEDCIQGIADLEKTLDIKSQLEGRNICHCHMCFDQHAKQTLPKEKKNISSRESHVWLKRILDLLCVLGTKSIKLYIPDILFVQGDSLEIFQTNRREARIAKLPGTAPLKTLFQTVLRLRKQYKGMLEENFNKVMLDKINPQFMHRKYFEKLVPSHFHDGFNSNALNENKNKICKYVLHKNDKYEIPGIEEHKMNEKEPFCLVKYKDENCQLFNQKQFQIYNMGLPSKIEEEVIYVQSFIKSKQETEAILFSEYSESMEVNEQLNKRAELYVMMLLGAFSKYDDEYRPLESLQEIIYEEMLSFPLKYVNLMTYNIVTFIKMTSRTYITHLKLKWIVNDIGCIYLQEVLELEVSELSKKPVRFRVAPTIENANFYKDSDYFLQIYQNMKMKIEINKKAIQSHLKTKSFQDIISLQEGIFQKGEIDTWKEINKQMQVAQDNNQFETKNTIRHKRKQRTNHLTTSLRTTRDYSNINPLKSVIQKGRYSLMSTYDPKQSIDSEDKSNRKSSKRKYGSLPRAQKLQIQIEKTQTNKIRSLGNKIITHFRVSAEESLKNQPNNLYSKRQKVVKVEMEDRLKSYLKRRNSKANESLLSNTMYQANKDEHYEQKQTYLSRKLHQYRTIEI